MDISFSAADFMGTGFSFRHYDERIHSRSTGDSGRSRIGKAHYRPTDSVIQMASGKEHL